jgi:hypothetical protein
MEYIRWNIYATLCWQFSTPPHFLLDFHEQKTTLWNSEGGALTMTASLPEDEAGSSLSATGNVNRHCHDNKY